MRLSLLFVIFVLLPLIAHSLGLGEIEVQSLLNQPLNARIKVDSANLEDLESLDIKMASTRDFIRSGIEKEDVLNDIRFKLITDAGKHYIHVTTHSVLREPFINFLLDIQWREGRILREYNVLLDPPEVAINRTQHSTLPTPHHFATIPETANKHSQTEVKTGNSNNSLSYGPTREHDTLWSVAYKMRPDDSFSVAQMMLALKQQNPKAFKQDNINSLMSGYTLKIDDVSTIGQIDRVNAYRLVKQQNQEWEARLAQTQQPVTNDNEDTTIVPSGQSVQTEEQSQDKSRLVIVGAQQSDTQTAAENLARGAEDSQKQDNVSADDNGVKAAELEKLLVLYEERIQSQLQENQQLKKRIAELEKIVSRRENLIELKNERLALLAGNANKENTDKLAQSTVPAQAVPGQSEADVSGESRISEETLTAQDSQRTSETEKTVSESEKTDNRTNNEAPQSATPENMDMAADIQDTQQIEKGTEANTGAQSSVETRDQAFATQADKMPEVEKTADNTNAKTTREEQAEKLAESQTSTQASAEQALEKEQSIEQKPQRDIDQKTEQQSPTPLSPEQQVIQKQPSQPTKAKKIADTTIKTPVHQQEKANKTVPRHQRERRHRPAEPDIMAQINTVLNDIVGNYLYEAGAAVGGILVLLAGWIVVRRKNQQAIDKEGGFQESILNKSGLPQEDKIPQDHTEKTTSEMTATGLEDETSFLSDFSSSELDSLQPDVSSFDDINEELEPFMSFQRYDQAEELLQSAIAKEPDNMDYQIKLLEVYQAADKQQDFSTQSDKIKQMLLDSGQDLSTSPYWEKVIALSSAMGLMPPVQQSMVESAPVHNGNDTVNSEIAATDTDTVDTDSPRELADDEIDVDELERQLNEFEAMLNMDDDFSTDSTLPDTNNSTETASLPTEASFQEQAAEDAVETVSAPSFEQITDTQNEDMPLQAKAETDITETEEITEKATGLDDVPELDFDLNLDGAGDAESSLLEPADKNIGDISSSIVDMDTKPDREAESDQALVDIEAQETIDQSQKSQPLDDAENVPDLDFAIDLDDLTLEQKEETQVSFDRDSEADSLQHDSDKEPSFDLDISEASVEEKGTETNGEGIQTQTVDNDLPALDLDVLEQEADTQTDPVDGNDNATADDITLDLSLDDMAPLEQDTDAGLDNTVSEQANADNSAGDISGVDQKTMVDNEKPAPIVDNDDLQLELDDITDELSDISSSLAAQEKENREDNANTADDALAELELEPLNLEDTVEQIDDSLFEMDNIGSKLDLAIALIEKGDLGEARDLLKKVTLNGNAQQIEEAKSLLEKCDSAA